MNHFIFLFLFIFLIASISAICNENQVDINTAPINELERLIGIGPVKAQAIIDARSFNTIDDLIKVSGIGEITLNNIKNQGLACVAEESNKEEFNENQEELDNNEVTASANTKVSLQNANKTIEKGILPMEFDTINLNPKDIKSEEGFGVLNKKDYALYGFIAFSIFIGTLFIANRKKHKNEFR